MNFKTANMMSLIVNEHSFIHDGNESALIDLAKALTFDTRLFTIMPLQSFVPIDICIHVCMLLITLTIYCVYIYIFDFARNVRNQNIELFMASFDIDSLFTNVPLEETIDISVNKLFGRKKKYKGFTKENFRK